MPDTLIKTKLLASAAITSVVGSKVGCGRYTTEQEPPAVLVFRTSVVPVRDLGGNDDGSREAVVDVWCVSTDYEEARDLADAVENALQGEGPEDDPSGWTEPPVSSLGKVMVTAIEYDPEDTGLAFETTWERFRVRCEINYAKAPT